MRNVLRPALPIIALICATVGLGCATVSSPQPTAATSTQPSIRPIGLQITLENGNSITLDSAQFQKLPRETVRVTNRDGGEAIYSGVALSPLLALVGTPAGEQLRGKALTYYIIAQGMDGYRVTLSIAEADPTFNDQHILIADRLNDCPLPENAQPLQLIIPGDKRTSRWVRMLAKIEVHRVP